MKIIIFLFLLQATGRKGLIRYLLPNTQEGYRSRKFQTDLLRPIQTLPDGLQWDSKLKGYEGINRPLSPQRFPWHSFPIVQGGRTDMKNLFRPRKGYRRLR